MDTTRLPHLPSPSWTLTLFALLLCFLIPGAEATVPNQTAIIVGTVIGILLIVCVVFAFIFLRAAVKRENQTTLYMQDYYSYDTKQGTPQTQQGTGARVQPSAPSNVSTLNHPAVMTSQSPNRYYYDNPAAAVNPSYAGPVVHGTQGQLDSLA